MSLDLHLIMNCSAGASMQLDKYEWISAPALQGDLGRNATDVTLKGEGFINAATYAAFNTACATLMTWASGQDFIITAQGTSPLAWIYVASCHAGGPHVRFEILDEDAAGLYRRVSFEARGTVVGGAVNTYTLRTGTAADGLITITQTGELLGNTATAAFAAVLSTFTSGLGAGYVVTHEATNYFGASGGFTTICRYQMQGTQLAGDLPGGVDAVDGELTVRSEFDEQHRQVDTWEYDLNLLPAGDANSAISALYSIANSSEGADAILIRQSTAILSIHKLRVRATFTFLLSQTNDKLLNHRRRVTWTSADPAYEELTYPGTTPIAVLKPTPFARISDSGSATGLGAFIVAPDAIGGVTAERPPVIILTDVSDMEKQTDWQYDGMDLDGTLDAPTIAGDIGRPSSPGTY